MVISQYERFVTKVIEKIQFQISKNKLSLQTKDELD